MTNIHQGISYLRKTMCFFRQTIGKAMGKHYPLQFGCGRYGF